MTRNQESLTFHPKDMFMTNVTFIFDIMGLMASVYGFMAKSQGPEPDQQ